MRKEDTAIPLNDIFCLYKLVNPVSVSGYEYIAVDQNRKFCINISSDLVSIHQVDWEVIRWIHCDYEVTGQHINFPLIELAQLIKTTFRETDFTLVAYLNQRIEIESVVLSFNSDHKYYEIEYKVNGKQLIKSANRGMERVVGELQSLHPDIELFKGIVRLLLSCSFLIHKS